jgi:hypothetical protein
MGSYSQFPLREQLRRCVGNYISIDDETPRLQSYERSDGDGDVWAYTCAISLRIGNHCIHCVLQDDEIYALQAFQSIFFVTTPGSFDNGIVIVLVE